MKRLLSLMAAVLLFGSIGEAKAGVIGFDFTGGGIQPGIKSNFNFGFEFTANTNTTITSLGAYDFQQNGFLQAQQVGLWDSVGTLLASTFVDNSDLLNGVWRFRSITAVSLIAGQSYTVGSQGGEEYIYSTSSSPITGLTIAPEISYTKSRYTFLDNTNNSPLTRPTLTDNLNGNNDNYGYFGGNLILGSDVSAVPEPATMTMLGIGVAGMFGFGLRRRRANTEATPA